MPGRHYLLRWLDHSDLTQLAGAVAAGSFGALRKALAMTPEAVQDEVRKGHLRGRGGAGFAAGTKWGYVPQSPGPRYLAINADEGEPGTFKDRELLGKDPFRVIEGAVIAAHAVGLTHGIVYFRGEFGEIARRFHDAIVEARKAGYLGRNVLGSGLDFDLQIHLGAGAYICGEETAMLESIEGKPGRPRLKPPFPAVAGVFGRPTVVNNVETLALVPLVLELGGEAFAARGVPGDGGVKAFGLSGHVTHPGLYELGMGKSIGAFIAEEGGGVLEGRGIKAVIPGGTSTPVLLPDQLDVPMTFDGLKGVGSMLGTGCVTVIAQGTAMVEVAVRIADFYAHESCGQCTPCREGCRWLAATMRKCRDGQGSVDDIELMLSICRGMTGRTICPFGEAASLPIVALINGFRDEFTAAARGRSVA